MDPTFAALDAVRLERVIQHRKWGTQRHSWHEWLGILGEEVGEATVFANWLRWPETGDGMGESDWLASMRMEFVHVAAVAVQIIELIDEQEATDADR